MHAAGREACCRFTRVHTFLTAASRPHPQFYGLRRGFPATLGILVGYLGIMHLITFAALLLVSRGEQR